MKYKDHISFLIVPENRTHPIKFRMSLLQFWIFSGIFVGLLVLFMAGVLMGGNSVKLYINLRNAEAENRYLKKQLEKIIILEKKVTVIEKKERFLRRLIGDVTEIDSSKYTSTYRVGFNAFSSNNLQNFADRIRFLPRGLPQNGALSVSYGANGQLIRGSHIGVDIALPSGKPVYSTAAGKVLFTGYDNSLGLLVVIDHLNGYVSKYGHLGRINTFRGNVIDRNSIIGFSGSSGKSIGSHIHYELEKDGKPINPLNEKGV